MSFGRYLSDGNTTLKLARIVQLAAKSIHIVIGLSIIGLNAGCRWQPSSPHCKVGRYGWVIALVMLVAIIGLLRRKRWVYYLFVGIGLFLLVSGGTAMLTAA